MGSIHAKVYSELEGCELVGVVDTQKDKLINLPAGISVSLY